jgi:hypothetical protein
VTDALDVAIVAPCAIVADMLILVGNATGYRMAFPLFGIIVFLMPGHRARDLAAGTRRGGLHDRPVRGPDRVLRAEGGDVGMGGSRGAPGAAAALAA